MSAMKDPTHIPVSRRGILKIGLLATTPSSIARSARADVSVDPAVTPPPLKDAVKLLAADGAAGDWFGYAVAIDGNTALVGAQLDDDNSVDSGSAYVFRRTGDTWNQQAKLLAPEGSTFDFFGRSVCISDNTALVGAPTSGNDPGSAYVFTRSGDRWRHTATLTASDGDPGDQFGWSVAIEDGTALVGAFRDEDPNGPRAGSAYVFTRTNGTWREQAKLVAEQGSAGDQFGWSVALAGKTALIGARDADPAGDRSGAAFVFRRVAGNWQQQAMLTDRDGGAGEYFGWDVALSGGTALVGAPAVSGPTPGPGSVVMFRRSRESWTQTATLTDLAGDPADSFGEAVAIHGNLTIIGAPGNDVSGENAGAAFVFRRSGGTWEQHQLLTPADGTPFDGLASAVAVAGNRVIVGTQYHDANGRSSGAAYVFNR